MFLKEKRENISVLPRRELSILLGFSNLGRIENPYGFSQFRYLRQNPSFPCISTARLELFDHTRLGIFLKPCRQGIASERLLPISPSEETPADEKAQSSEGRENAKATNIGEG